MQTDKDITIYIGVTNNCDEAIVSEINKCCQLLTSKNANGGQLLLVTESNINYQQADYLINMKEGDLFLTRNDKAFNVKLANNNPLTEVMYAFTASWFLANLVGHDYADYVSCLYTSKSSKLSIIEITNVEEIRSFLSTSSEDTLAAVTCYIEAEQHNMTCEWFEKLGYVLQKYFDEETFSVVTMSAKSRMQSKNKIYLTYYFK
jgi:hypothetical protein